MAFFLQGVLAGVFLGSALVEQAMAVLEAREWVAYKQAKERLFGPVMPAFFGVTLLAGVATLVLAPGTTAGVAVGLLVAALVVTVVVHLPLNRVFQSWSPDAAPAGWNGLRARWRSWNWVRCAMAMAAFAVVVPGRA
jgi:uncharacterized membrane protein